MRFVVNTSPACAHKANDTPFAACVDPARDTVAATKFSLQIQRARHAALTQPAAVAELLCAWMSDDEDARQ